MAYVVVAAIFLMVGSVVGFTIFRRSLQWCPRCGAQLSCVDCSASAFVFSGSDVDWRTRS